MILIKLIINQKVSVKLISIFVRDSITYCKCEHSTAVDILVSVNANKALRFLIEHTLERYYYKLEGFTGIFSDVIRYLSHIGIIKCCIHFVENKEWRWVIASRGMSGAIRNTAFVVKSTYL